MNLWNALKVTHGSLGRVCVCVFQQCWLQGFCFVCTSGPTGDSAMTDKVTDWIPGFWWVMCECVRGHECVARSLVHIGMRRHRGFSARLRKSHVALASNPLPGTRPDDSSALLYFHVCQTWHLGAHAHISTQMLSACYHLFRHLSLPSETEFVNLLPTTSMESAHSVSQSHLKSFDFLSN